MSLAFQADAVAKAIELWPALLIGVIVILALTPVIAFLFKRYEKEREARRIERDEAHKHEIEGRDKALKDTLETHERVTRTLASELAGSIERATESSNRVISELASELRRRT